jgi:hypothetical protein
MNPRISGSLLLCGLLTALSLPSLSANDAHTGASPTWSSRRWSSSNQGKMSRIVSRHLEQVVKYLDKADKAVASKNERSAKSNLEQAETQWKTFHDWNKGKFDPKDSAVLAAGKQIKATRKSVAGLGIKVKATPSGSPKPASVTMNRIVSNHLEGVENHLARVEKSIADKNRRQAEISMEQADRHWKTFQEWNVGKFDPKDPKVLAVAKKMDSMRAKVAALAAKASDMSKGLSVVLAVILENEKALQVATKKAGYSLRDFQSDAWDYRRIAKARKQLHKIPGEVAAANDLLLDTVAACRAFRKQIPDMKDLKKLVKDGYMAINALKRVEGAPKRWLEEISGVTKASLDVAEKNIAIYGARLKTIDGLEEIRRINIAGNAYEWGVDHADLMLSVVPAVFPELSPEGKQVFPAYVRARKAFVVRASGLEIRSKKIAAEVGKVKKQIVDTAARRIQDARFPKTQYGGKKWADADQMIRKAFAKKIRDKKLLKVAIDSPWSVRKEARWRNDRWVIGTYRYIGAHCLAKLASGKCYVYHMFFRRTLQANGSWSDLEQWSVGHVYEIAENNVDK